jgi:carbon monoxide dehydrogenase subunit G
MTMATHRAEIDIDRAADDVWAVVGDFENLDWFPGHERLELHGDERTSWMEGVTPGNVERLIARDDILRTFTYATVGVVGDSRVPRPDGGVFDTATLVGHHQATITVLPTGEASCHVNYDVTVDDNDTMAAAISQGYGRVLASLKAQLEG